MTLVARHRESPLPVVRSSAKPSAESLLLARALIQRHQHLGELFVRHKAEGKSTDWLRDMLAPLVAGYLVDGYPYDSVVEACQYLADEHDQLAVADDVGCYLVDQESGEVRAVVREADLHDAGMLPRDSGLVGQALPRLKPALEVAIVTQAHERAREAGALTQLGERGHPTDLVRESGDSRLRVASRAGRTDIARDLSEHEPWELLQRAGGMAGEFMRRCIVGASYDTEGLTEIKGVASCQSVFGVQDVTTSNLAYDRLSALRAIAPQAWARDIARAMGAELAKGPQMVLGVADLTTDILDWADLWVVSPDVYMALPPEKREHMFVVDGVATMYGVTMRLGYLSLADEMGVETREASDRWTITATVQYSLWTIPSRFRAIAVQDVAHAAEIRR